MKPKNEKKEPPLKSSTAEYLTYIASLGDNVHTYELRYEDENIWLTQKSLANLYGVDVRTISYHINKIFKDGELQQDSVIQKYWITADDGKDYNTLHYNLQMIIAVGFKVSNERAVQFRKWANNIIKEYTIKGFVMNDERFKNGGVLTDTQAVELLAEVGGYNRNAETGEKFDILQWSALYNLTTREGVIFANRKKEKLIKFNL